MKKLLLLFIATAITLSFTSCSEEECDHITTPNPITPDKAPVIGWWYEEAENEEVHYNENGTLYDKYCNVRSSSETEGRWEYDAATQKLTNTYSFLGQVIVSDWTIKEATNLSFSLSSTKVGDHKEEKIVENYSLKVGETINIKFPQEYPEYNVVSYSSKNPYLASVTHDGTITATGEKGTTYIKIEYAGEGNGNAWVKVVVGDDCMDIWYDWATFMGADFNTLAKALGQYSAKGEDGNSFGWDLSVYNLYASEIDVFLNENTGKVDQMALTLKDIPEAHVRTYLNSHYYSYELGKDFYSTGPEADNSRAIVFFNKETNSIFFLNPKEYAWPDYTYTFGYTTNQVVKEFGDLFFGMPMYEVYNIFINLIYFNIDSNSDKVTAFILYTNDGIPTQLVYNTLSKKYNHLKTDETKTMFAFCDAETVEEATVMVVYDSNEGSITFYDLLNFGKSSVSKTKKKEEILKGYSSFVE